MATPTTTEDLSVDEASDEEFEELKCTRKQPQREVSMEYTTRPRNPLARQLEAESQPDQWILLATTPKRKAEAMWDELVDPICVPRPNKRLRIPCTSPAEARHRARMLSQCFRSIHPCIQDT
ncbi:hypothetical protein AC1031_006826 [Aphanomyces cochlioides]|nr:hypothetical protein AC1031_006826 [Aphanomyces cochlioides]